MIPASRVIAEFSRKSAPHANFNAAREYQAPPNLTEPDLRQHDDQRSAAENSHNRRITGIGTPSSQSRSPGPILAHETPRIQERERERQVPENGTEKLLGNVRSSTRIAAAIEGPRL
jgi:hypothetical protein